MKHRLFLVSATLFITLLFTACEKDDMNKVFDVNFYTSNPSGKMILYIDDVAKGELSHFDTAPVCGQAFSDGANPISMQLKAGEYLISGKNDLGQIVAYGTIKITEHKLSTSGGMGGISITKNEDCVTVGLFE